MKQWMILLVAILALVIIVVQVAAGGDGEPAASQTGSEEMSLYTTDPVLPPGLEDDAYRKPSNKQLQEALTPEQFIVTQQDGTEPPFRNYYWNNHEEGIYVDVVSGEPLFSSTDKYESGTGWPSFYRPLSQGNIVTVTDSTYGMVRTEVRSLFADSHLGHLFNDGPEPTGLRYCMNSASMRFVPVENLEQEGYGRYLDLFEE